MSTRQNPRCVVVFLAVIGLAGLALGAGCGSDAAPAAVPDPISVNTLDGGEGVPVDSTFKYAFSRPMITSAVTKSTFFIVKNEVSSSLNKAVVDGGICDSTQALDVSVGCSSPAECTLTPAELLEYSSVYSICLTGNMQYDTGERFDGFMATFTAEMEGPLDLNNLNGVVDVPVDSSFRYRFLKEVDTSTVDASTYFIVPTVDPATCDAANAVASEITCTRWSCTIAPSAYLEYITGYTACLASGISYTSSFTFNSFMASFTTSDLPSPTNLGLSVVNRRAAQIELSWDSSSDIPNEWENVRHAEVRCVEDEPITLANWDTAMQFADDPISGASVINWTMLVAEDINGNKIRAGHDYYCGIRGRSIIDNQWSSLMTFGVISQSDIALQQYASTIDNYTQADTWWWYWPSISAAGDVNGDGFDDLLVGYGGSAVCPGGCQAAALVLGSASGPTSPVDINCSDSSFGAAMAGIGDFDNDGYPDIAVGAPDEDRAYIFRGSAGFGSSSFNCSAADVTIVDAAGNWLGSVVVAAGNYDGDDYADLAVGAVCDNGNDGAAYVILGRDESTWPVTINLVTGANADGSLHVNGEVGTGDYFGDSLAAWDFDKDGAASIVFGIPYGGSSGYGAVAIMAGDPAALKTPDTVIEVAYSSLQVIEYPSATTAEVGLGMGITPIDIDGDTWVDLAVGGRFAEIGGPNNCGNVVVFPNDGTGTITSTYVAELHGSSVYDLFGVSVGGVYNMTVSTPIPWKLNGLATSASDLAVFAGAQQFDGTVSTGPGYVGLWYAGITGSVGVDAADILFSPPAGSESYMWAAFVGDLDGDGYVDLAIGDPDYGSGGRTYVYH